ncbi:MAG: hypothetical protein R3192_12220 [Woeseiaceae bacterium]|nr:hypothetical protein [Woeseiaceae bacterium]
MSNLDTLANYAEILGVLSVVAGIVFAIFQLRQYRRQRTALSAVELIRAWQTPEFTKAIKTLQLLPNCAPPESLRDDDGELEDMAFVVGMFFEGVGVMVYRNLIPLEIVNDLMGGVTRVVWTKLSPWVEEWRVKRNPRAYEWWDWLNQRLDNLSPLVVDHES